ncbi:MAG TPA: PIN domain-containing protein [Lacipirellulaceae bacterium]
MALVIIRCVFLMMAITLGFQLLNSRVVESYSQWVPWAGFLGVMLIAAGVLAADVAMRRKRLDTITAVYFGTIIGLFLTYVFRIALTPLLEGANEDVLQWVQLAIATVVCYLCISVLLQTKDDFRFIIPYVEFAKEVKGLKPYVLDTSVVIDGRIADVVETRVIDNQLVMPQFVIAELQSIADLGDKLKRNRGRRGLDILNRLRSDPKVDLMIWDRELPEFAGQPVDQKLVLLAKHLEGKVVTNDYNLNKVAKLHNVGVINLNDIANSLKPVFLPGESIDVRIVKLGEEPGQGVGYLEDGTMVVIEGGRDHVGENVAALVTSVLQTSAGRMVFGRYERTIGDSDDMPRSARPPGTVSRMPTKT